MTRVIVNETLRSMLHGISEPLELCDESGRVLGRVLPTVDLSQYEPTEPQISEEEIERRCQSKGKRYTTKEVLDYLEKL
jgi:hypothetical protein